MTSSSVRKSSLALGTALLSFIALFFLPHALFAQNPTGSVRGVVQDASGARVPGARISIQSDGTSVQRDVLADSHGEFRVDNLPPGAYRLIVQVKGFDEAQSQVTVQIGTVRDVTIALKLQGAEQKITVQGEPSSITTQEMNTSSAVRQAVVTAHDLDTLPLAARSFANIAYLAPGTEPLEPSDPD
jgi:hypothetical protein